MTCVAAGFYLVMRSCVHRISRDGADVNTDGWFVNAAPGSSLSHGFKSLCELKMHKPTGYLN